MANYRISICAKHCAYTELTNIETMKARAKRNKKDKDYVYGFLHQDGKHSYIFQDQTEKGITGSVLKPTHVKVDPSTIEYQINGEWLSEEEIQNRCAITKNLCDWVFDQKEWIETSNQLKEENARLRADLKSVDEILEELEDYTHGAIGDKITVARIKLKP